MAEKTPRTVRTTISIPADLKRRMAEVAEPINWSALAADAFQNKLAAIAARKKEIAMSSVVERLRASQRKSETADYQSGYDLGKRWAEQSAEASELQHLEDFRDQLMNPPQYDWDDFFEQQEDTVYGTHESLFFAMHPGAESDREAAKDFWDCVLGDTFRQAANVGAMLKGFSEGAIDLWLSVKDDL